jgi:hypothetical protein
VYFFGDMLCYGGWGPGHFVPAERMANVALWRLHLESMMAPVGTGTLLAWGYWHVVRLPACRTSSRMVDAGRGVGAVSVWGSMA